LVKAARTKGGLGLPRLGTCKKSVMSPYRKTVIGALPFDSTQGRKMQQVECEVIPQLNRTSEISERH